MAIPEKPVPAQPVRIDPEVGIPDLVRRLSDDSKRLMTDEIRLAKIEMNESMHRATRGAMWMALALGASAVMFVGLTIFLVTLIGRAINGHMWIGAIVTGVLELAVGTWLVKRGLSVIAQPSYSLEASRLALADTAHWATSIRKP